MMSQRPAHILFTLVARTAALLALACVLCSPAFAQTPGGTTISNQASATYSDGTNSYSTISNTVTVTVSLVSGLTITPDAGTSLTDPTVVAGQALARYGFTVTNTGNFTDQVRFASGSARVNAPNSVIRAYIDADNSGTFNVGDTDVTSGGLSGNILQNGSISVMVEVAVHSSVSSGSSVTVFLGDASTGGPTFDNQPADSSPLEVRTESALSVNGQREARGDISSTVVDDALLQLELTAPPGPVPVGSDITYTWQLNNISTKDASGVTLNASNQVYIIAPIPLRTVLRAGQTFPAGTLYTTSALTTAPLAATWVSSAPPLNTVTRIAFPVGVSLAGGASSSPINMIVTINTGINASIPIDEIGDAFATNVASSIITDQSGDLTTNNGDGNADFNEGYVAGVGHGVIQQTLLSQLGSVLLGPLGAPAAVGPTDNNDDYTNKSSNPANIAPGGVTTAAAVLTYSNTVQNTGNANDIYTLDAPTVPAGFTVAISTDGGGSYTTVSGGGSTTLAVGFASSADILVQVTIPVGQAVLTGFSTTIRATSTVTAAANNRTIDRAYTGFVQLSKSFSVANATGVGGPTDAVPGAVITYNITYTNVSTSNGDANCVKLTASNLVINEDGLVAPNNWGTFTTNSGVPSDNATGVVVIVSATRYTDTIATLAPGASGIFTFMRSIN